MLMASAASCNPVRLEKDHNLAAWIGAVAVHPLHALLVAPNILFLVTLTLILFRPPNVGLFPFDRIAFLLLVVVVGLRTLFLRDAFPCMFSISIPMLGLTLLAVAGNWQEHAFAAEDWSLVAAKFVVPFILFHLAAVVFTGDSRIRQLEIFCLAILAYLCFVSIAFLLGAAELIFPKFILDGSIEMHADRARGPFLQAAANGIALNLLGLVLLDRLGRARIRWAIAASLLVALPLAIFATRTRSVWLSFLLSFLAIALTAKQKRLRRASLYIVLGATAVLAVTLASSGLRRAFQERFADQQTVDFRLAVYQLSWDMIREKPLLGWGQGQFGQEIESRISDYRPENYAAHNTYIEVLVEHGAVGITFYAWLFISLFRLGKESRWFHTGWPIFLGVYLLNACFVVVNYQFVNALVFTFAGVLAAQGRYAGHPGEMENSD